MVEEVQQGPVLVGAFFTAGTAGSTAAGTAGSTAAGTNAGTSPGSTAPGSQRCSLSWMLSS